MICGNVSFSPERRERTSSLLSAMNAEESLLGTGENTMPSMIVMNEENALSFLSPTTIRYDADESAPAHERGEVNTERDGMNTTAQGAFSSHMRLASLGESAVSSLPTGKKNEGAAKCILSSSSDFFLKKAILLGKFSVAFLADLDLVSVDLLLVKALDGCSAANRAGSSAIVELIADTCSSMCFGHLLLLMNPVSRRLYPIEEERSTL